MRSLRSRIAAGLLLAGIAAGGIATQADASPVGTRYSSAGNIFTTGDGKVFTVGQYAQCDEVHQSDAMHLNCSKVTMASGTVIWSYESRPSGRNAFVLYKKVGANSWKRSFVARESTPGQWADARAMAYDVDRDGKQELVVGLRRYIALTGPLDLYVIDYWSGAYRTVATIKDLEVGGATVIAGSLRTVENLSGGATKDWNRVERVNGVWKVTRRAVRDATLPDLWYSDF